MKKSIFFDAPVYTNIASASGVSSQRQVSAEEDGRNDWRMATAFTHPTTDFNSPSSTDEIELKKTQRKKVLAYLKEGNKLSQRDCAHMFNAWRLSAIIYGLRKDGHNITTRMVKSKNTRYGEYSIT